jgi:hypothetical protein
VRVTYRLLPCVHYDGIRRRRKPQDLKGPCGRRSKRVISNRRHRRPVIVPISAFGQEEAGPMWASKESMRKFLVGGIRRFEAIRTGCRCPPSCLVFMFVQAKYAWRMPKRFSKGSSWDWRHTYVLGIGGLLLAAWNVVGLDCRSLQLRCEADFPRLDPRISTLSVMP